MPYSVPQNIDPNKIFLVNFSELEGRLDPIYYASKFLHRFTQSHSVKLKDVCVSFSSGFGAGKDEQTDEKNGYIQIRPTNINNNGELVFDKNVFVPLQKTVGFVEKRTVLFNNTNSQELVGKTAILLEERELYTSNHITSIVVDETQANAEYIWIILNVYQRNKIFFSLCTNWNNQSGIGLDLLQSLKIPVPPLHIQQQIVNVYNAALSQRKKKLSESKAKLASIDQYLLGELGITLPEDSHEKTFIVNYKDVDGGRLDPSIYKKNFKLISSRYENVKLSKLAFINPSTTYKKLTADTKISFVPMEQIDEIYSEISFMEDKKVSESTGYTRFMDGDLLWAKITPCMQNGKSAIARNLSNGYGCGSTEFFVLRPRSNELSIEYIHNILHMQIVRETAMLYFGGSAGQQRVSSSFLEKFNLPLPPLSKQREIADHISAIRVEAKALEQEADAILEQAKKEVEELILKESD